MIIIETDNHNGDYPDEKVILKHLSKLAADNICKELNKEFCYADHCDRFYKVEDDDYKLQPGFEP